MTWNSDASDARRRTVITCFACGREQRMSGRAGDHLAKELQATGIEVTEIRLSVRGLCPACRTRRDRSLLRPIFEEG